MKNMFLFVGLFLITAKLQAQDETSKSTFWHPIPRNYEVKQAIEVESLVPMFITGGYHFAVGYRYRKFRVRLSIINGGTYDAEKVGLKTRLLNSKDSITLRLASS
jgi:hypothetical protein